MGKVQEVAVHEFFAKNARGKDPSELTTAALCFNSVVHGEHGQKALTQLRAVSSLVATRQAIAYADSLRLCQNLVVLAAAFEIPENMITVLTTFVRDHTIQAAGIPIHDYKAMEALITDTKFLSEAGARDLQEILATATQTGGQA